jgi:hypothetical protein
MPKGINSGSANGSWKGGITKLHHVDDALLKSKADQKLLWEYLLTKVTKKSNGCWIWNRERDEQAYCGRHRLAYVLYYQSPIKNLKVCHKCDTPACINPKHLFKGTHQDNVDDQVSKRRQCHGERNGRALLTEADVLLIRNLYKRGSHTSGQVALAKQFGVPQTSISAVVRGIHWKYVGGPIDTRTGRKSTLTEDQVLEIRSRYVPFIDSHHPSNQRQLAKEFGVSTAVIYFITHGITWKHLL